MRITYFKVPLTAIELAEMYKFQLPVRSARVSHYDTCLMLTFEFHFKSSLLKAPFHTFLFLITNFTLALKDVRK